MKYRITCLFFLIHGFYSALGQTAFQRILGGNDDDGFFCVRQTSEGGYILTGSTQSYGIANGKDDILLIKTDPDGNVSWIRTYGDSLTENANCVRQAADSGYFITGRTLSHGNGSADIFLLRTDKNGSPLFFRTYGGISYENAQSLAITSDGGCIIVGGTYSFGAGDQDALLLKVDSAGILQWQQTYGASQFDHATCVLTKSNGNFLIGGRTTLMGNMDIILFETDPTGDTLWSKLYYAAAYEETYGIAADPAGSIVISGTTSSSGAGYGDIIVLKTDSAGNLLDKRTYGGPEAEAAYSIYALNDSGFAVAGYTESYHEPLLQHDDRGSDSAHVILLRLNNALDTLWTSIYGGPSLDESYSVIQTTDSGFAIAAFQKSYGGDSLKGYFIKTTANGNSNCHQALITPAVGNPSISVFSFPFTITAGNFTSGLYFPVVGAVIASDSSICNPTGFTEPVENKTDILIYPDPVLEEATIYFPGYASSPAITYEIYDIFGKKRIGGQLTGTHTRFSRGHAAAGMYFYRIMSQGRLIKTGKLLMAG